MDGSTVRTVYCSLFYFLHLLFLFSVPSSSVSVLSLLLAPLSPSPLVFSGTMGVSSFPDCGGLFHGRTRTYDSRAGRRWHGGQSRVPATAAGSPRPHRDRFHRPGRRRADGGSDSQRSARQDRGERLLGQHFHSLGLQGPDMVHHSGPAGAAAPGIGGSAGPDGGRPQARDPEESTLARIVRQSRPHAIVDCINTATAFAYQNLYQSARELLAAADAADPAGFREAVESHLCKLYIPHVVRHMQILQEVLQPQPDQDWPGVKVYVKVGTSGTGGMGLNIPYTHGEEKPSSVLLSKTAVAGAHSLLLFLLARTSFDLPAIKEIKPTAAIGWAEIGFGPIRRGGKPIALYDCPPDQAYPLADALAADGDYGTPLPGGVLENVYIDTGENGLFALGEFSTITSLNQMEFVTPEEIARYVALEIKGGNTGFDVISALDQSVLGPTYRAGILREGALRAHAAARIGPRCTQRRLRAAGPAAALQASVRSLPAAARQRRQHHSHAGHEPGNPGPRLLRPRSAATPTCAPRSSRSASPSCCRRATGCCAGRRPKRAMPTMAGWICVPRTWPSGSAACKRSGRSPKRSWQRTPGSIPRSSTASLWTRRQAASPTPTSSATWRARIFTDAEKGARMKS